MENNRLHSRILFEQNDEINCLIFPVNRNENAIKVSLLSLGEGGLSFNIDVKYKKTLNTKENIKIQLLNQKMNTCIEQEIELNIKYLLFPNRYGQITAGGEFVGLNPQVKRAIKDWIKEDLQSSPSATDID